MKNLILFVVVVCLFGCKKSKTAALTYTDQQIWDSVGLQYGEKYICEMGTWDTIIFNSDNTITETLIGLPHKTITYPVVTFGKYFPARGNSSAAYHVCFVKINDTASGFHFHDVLTLDTVDINRYQFNITSPNHLAGGQLFKLD